MGCSSAAPMLFVNRDFTVVDNSTAVHSRSVRLHMPRVMVVDDDPEIRASLAMALGRAGYDVASAEDGRSALQRMRDQKPDLLLTDIMMPHTDGWALIRSIRADANLADMKVLVMSGSLRMRELAIQHSAVGFLLKPFNWATAVGEVTRVLNCQNCP